VITTNSGSGTLAVHLEGPSKVAVVCTEVDEGYDFTYTPMAPGKYMIVIKYCNVPIAGCPFRANITGEYCCETLMIILSKSHQLNVENMNSFICVISKFYYYR
jgi:hypothetical protein